MLSPLLYGCLTGIVTGAVLALFLVCARVVSHFSAAMYATDGPLAVVCILILVVLCCLLTAVIQTLCPSAKGSGIPLAEGAARGMLRVKWLSSAASLISGSILAFLCGMPLGSEGPSIGVGGLVGEGVGKTAKMHMGSRRYLITGGAATGLAVAFNAPLAGLCFAFEETHRRFSPYILAAAFSSVITGVLTSQGIFYGFSLIPYLSSVGVKAGSAPLGILKQSPISGIKDLALLCAAAVICGTVCAAIGAAFNRTIYALGKVFSKIKTPFIRLLPAFVFAAVCGLSIKLAAGSGENIVEHISADSTLKILLALLILRFLSTALASGAQATGGLFLPMIAIGALVGAIAAKACGACGLNGAYSPNIIMICVCAFFASSVRAPITAIVLSVELTGSFGNLLPCAIAVSLATILTDFTATAPLYERMLENLVKSAPAADNTKDITVRGVVTNDSPIAMLRVRNVMWPYNSLVTGLKRGGSELVPDGETAILPGDELTVRAENVDSSFFYTQMSDYIKIYDAPSIRPDDGNFTGNVISTAQNKMQ